MVDLTYLLTKQRSVQYHNNLWCKRAVFSMVNFRVCLETALKKIRGGTAPQNRPPLNIRAVFLLSDSTLPQNVAVKIELLTAA